MLSAFLLCANLHCLVRAFSVICICVDMQGIAAKSYHSKRFADIVCCLFTDDNDVIGSKSNHVTGSAQVDGLERWNSYEDFSGLSTTSLTADGIL